MKKIKSFFVHKLSLSEKTIIMYIALTMTCLALFIFYQQQLKSFKHHYYQQEVLQQANLYLDMMVSSRQSITEQNDKDLMLDYKTNMSELKENMVVWQHGMAWKVGVQSFQLHALPNSKEKWEFLEVWSNYLLKVEEILGQTDRGLADPSQALNNLELTKMERNLSDILAVLRVNHRISIDKAFTYFYFTSSMLIFIFLIIIGVSIYWIIQYLLKPYKELVKSINESVSSKQLPQIPSHKDGEIDAMISSINFLIENLRRATEFTLKISEGKFDEDAILTDSDGIDIKNTVLSRALISLRDKLVLVSEEDRRRNWTNEGIAKFGELLRTDNSDIQLFCDTIIKHFVSYLEANQGGLFLIEEQEEEEPCLNLISCYAWEKKKFVERKVLKGEGLIGQSWQEKDTLYVTEVPDDYIQITSGLGKANPTCILIVPLIANDQIFGVIELASFSRFEPYQIEFTQKVGESIAASISSVIMNAKTKTLLAESQENSIELRQKEEEMRQQMEELQATQEEMHRTQTEMNYTNTLFSESFVMMEANANLIIKDINEQAGRFLKYNMYELKGQPLSMIISKSKLDDGLSIMREKKIWQEEMEVITKGGVLKWMRISGGIIHTDNEEMYRLLFILTDIHEIKVFGLKLRGIVKEYKDAVEALKSEIQEKEKSLKEVNLKLKWYENQFNK